MAHAKVGGGPSRGRHTQVCLLTSCKCSCIVPAMNMLEVIVRGAAEAARRERPPDEPKPCPFCGTDPPLAAQIAGRYVVGCESDGCAANPQVSAASVGAPWSRWNSRAPA